ncbi:hypothetical protein ACFYWX_31600 [Streptomyces sp. NPDC002888]|uniref:hypothetical protein n=1 Tax=Streptomyces sp. NPDC002888 TaxID=3364668 RepID=UPI0036C1721B
MPQTPVRPPRSDGEFAELFARRARTPLRGFLPGRRVFNAVGASVAVVLVIAGVTAVVSRIDWGGGPQQTTTATAKKADAKEKHSTGGSGAPAVAASSDAPARRQVDEAPGVVGRTDSGGSGGGAGSGESDSGRSGTSGDDSASGDSQVNSPASTGSSPEPTAFLWSDGSVETDTNDYWDQSAVTVKSTKPLTGLKVVVKIIQTGGVAGTGTWTSLGDKVSVASATTSGELDYVVTLKSGVTLDPGTYVFRFQYNHDQGGRDAGGDRYNVTATSTASATEFRKGAF